MKRFSKKFLLIPIVLLSLLSIAYILFRVNSTKKTTTPTQKINVTTAPADLDNIIPGKTTREEVVEILGQPQQDTQGNGKETLLYTGTSKTLDHQIIIEGGVVAMVKEMIMYGDPEKVSDITKIYGLSVFSLYRPGSGEGSKLYINPDKGIAYIGMPQFDTLEEIWHFIPMSIGDFKQKWASNYSDKPTLNPY